MESSALQNFNFAEPGWLWGLCLPVVMWILYKAFYKPRAKTEAIEAFADPHLLPHLLASGDGKTGKESRFARPLLAWSLIWALGFVAMAGPRWDYTDVKAFAPARNLVILLDLSQSMDAQDVKPSRLARARQEILDISRAAEGLNIGLITFDSVPHIITPLTDDKETLGRLLPSLNTGLVYAPGDNLAPALDLAGSMLSSEQGNDKHVLIVSAGSFQDGAAAIYRAEKKLTGRGVRVHVMGVGTPEGAPAPDGKNGFIQKDGAPAMFRLEEDRLRRIADDGQGIYVAASYLDSDTKAILAQADRQASAERDARKTTRFWDEQFYLFLLPAALILLPWFRRNAAFPLALVLCLMSAAAPARAGGLDDLFLNKAQQGAAALESKQYDDAIQKFDDPYRRGVAQYRAGKYDEAAKSFGAAKNQDAQQNARYNLGNAQLMNGKIEDAISTYESVLKDNPQHENARHNLEIAKKLLEQQQKPPPKSNPQDKQDNKDQPQDKKDQQSQQKQDNKDQKQGQDSQQSQQKQDNKDQKQGQDSQQAQQKQDEKDQKQGQDGQQAQQKQDEKDQKQGQEGQQAQQKQDEKDQKQGQDSQQAQQKQDEKDQKQGQAGQPQRSQRDISADQWLDRIQNDPESFLKNKFYIETARQNKSEGETP